MTNNMNNHGTVVCGLIKGRHEMPVEQYIFDTAIDDVMDFNTISLHIRTFIADKVGITTGIGTGLNQYDYTDVQVVHGNHGLVVYVTGLTAVTAELIRVCAMNGIHLTLMHYNTATGCYVEQPIFW